MLELTRRMTPARSSFTRVAGAYFDEELNAIKGADKERQYFIMLINLRANLLHDKDRRSIIAP